jgi:hypothetical protein
MSAFGPLRSSNDHDAKCWRAPSRGRVCGGAPLRRSAPLAPTALRCSGFGRAAKLAALTAFVALEQSQRVRSRSARVRAPTESLRASPPHRRAPAHPPTAWRGSEGSLWEKATSRASSPALALWRACGARQAAGSMPVAYQTPSPKNDRSRKAWGRPVPGCVCDGEEASPDTNSPVDCSCLASGWALAPSAACKASPGVGARTRALRRLTRRNCSSATNAVNEASFAARPRGEHRSAPRAAGRRIRSPAPAGPKPCSRTADHQAYLRTFANSHNGPQTEACVAHPVLREARRGQ